MQLDSLEKKWSLLTTKYCSTVEVIEESFNLLKKKYKAWGRYYHTFNHINKLLTLSEEFKDKLLQKDIVDFAIFYHDAIYFPLKSDNEEKSAELASVWLRKLCVPKDKIEEIKKFILATKSHKSNNTSFLEDQKYLLDFDLSILSEDNLTYIEYTDKIRMEYRVYPDFLYKPGRRKKLESFLQKEHIYFTPEFKCRETQARFNIEAEINLLK